MRLGRRYRRLRRKFQRDKIHRYSRISQCSPIPYPMIANANRLTYLPLPLLPRVHSGSQSSLRIGSEGESPSLNFTSSPTVKPPAIDRSSSSAILKREGDEGGRSDPGNRVGQGPTEAWVCQLWRRFGCKQPCQHAHNAAKSALPNHAFPVIRNHQVGNADAGKAESAICNHNNLKRCTFANAWTSQIDS